MSSLNKYIIWERPCYPGIVYIAAEACVFPHIKDFGRPWADTLCFFEKGMVKVLWDKKDLTDNGLYITNNFLKPEYFRRQMNHYRDLENGLKRIWKKTEKTDLKKISDEELLNLIREYNRIFLDWWGFAQVAEPIAVGSEHLLNKKIKLSQEQMSILTTPTKKSYTIREEEDLLRIVDYVLSSRKLKNLFSKKRIDLSALSGDEKLVKLLENHVRKYFWLNNGYAEIEYLKAGYFIKVIRRIIKEGMTRKEIADTLDCNKKRLKEFKRKIRRLEKELSFNQRDRRLVELVDCFADFQDKRKALSIKGNYYTYLFLKEVGRRNRIPLTDMLFILPRELEQILSCKFSKTEFKFKQRKKHFALLFKTSGLEIYKGEKSRKQEKRYLGKDSLDKITEFEGKRAMGGKVTGKVRRILKTPEMKNMQKGEILVTTMTSPDFISAIRKAKAMVTDEGGLTCHAAVISRELNIPCVTGTKIATRVLKNGDLVKVNANHGLITVIKRS